MTSEKLKVYTKKKLASMAKRRGIGGWHSMRKAQLIEALAEKSSAAKTPTGKRKSRTRPSQRKNTPSSKRSKRTRGQNSKPGSRNGRVSASSVKKSKQSTAANSGKKKENRRKMQRLAASESGKNRSDPQLKDKLHVKICDAYWLQAQWSLTGKTLERAEAALGSEWHQAAPYLRVFDVTSDDSISGNSKTWVSDTKIQADTNCWYVRVEQPCRSYRLHVGYLAPSGKFYVLARSNTVRTPQPGTPQMIKSRTATASSSCFQGFRRFSTHSSANGTTSKGNTNGHHYQNGKDEAAGATNGMSSPSAANGKFDFQVDAELVVHGVTHPEAELSLLGKPVELGEDGTFQLRISLSEGRQVIPAVAVTPKGDEQHTIVLAIERNTKELEPQVFDETHF